MTAFSVRGKAVILTVNLFMSRNNNQNKRERYYNQTEILREYGLTKKILEDYFPAPEVRYVGKKYRYTRLWKESDVLAAMQNPKVQAAAAEHQAKLREAAMQREIAAKLLAYTPDSMIRSGTGRGRTFVLHVGPTNSGKTYDAVEALKQAGNGVYLGPLRLLALEMYDKLNAAGYPCSLLTGEESLPVEGAQYVASTIELCNFRKHYRVAVIDEAQLVTDGDRGSNWLRAICQVNADEVHICLAPEALTYIEDLVKQFGDPYTVRRHERLVPLVYSGRLAGFEELQPKDAIICFSRKNVLSTAAQLEKAGFRASVIYGALPPAARRNEVDRYNRGETNIIVATDAIGMGISLPIRRVIFAETRKFDGVATRDLTPGEVRQIAGRAGRYGMFDLGEVLTMDESDIIENGLKYSAARVKAPCISFPREMLDTDYPIDLLLKTWQKLPPNAGFKREDMQDALYLYTLIQKHAQNASRELIFNLITCPVDSGSRELAMYWQTCALRILRGSLPRTPSFDIETLMGCELQYKGYDIYHQLITRTGGTDDSTAEREAICKRIAELMEADKTTFIRHCSGCGKELPIGYSYNLCEACFRRQRSWRRGDRN